MVSSIYKYGYTPFWKGIMSKFNFLKMITEEDIPLVWGSTKFHRMAVPVDTAYSEDEERSKHNFKSDRHQTDDDEHDEEEHHHSEKHHHDHHHSEKHEHGHKHDHKHGHDKKKEHKDPNRRGVIRRVAGAHLVFKRKNENGSYDELWMFPYDNAFVEGNLRKAVTIKRAILAGTDIPVKASESPDGSQSFEQQIIGTAQFIFITGLTQ